MRGMKIFSKRWLYDSDPFLQLNDWLKENPNYKIIHIEYLERRNTYREEIKVIYEILNDET